MLQQMKHSSSSCKSTTGSSGTAFPFPLSFDLSFVLEDSGNTFVLSSGGVDPDFSPVISTSSSYRERSAKSSSSSLSGIPISKTSPSSSPNAFLSSRSSSVELTLTGLICRPLPVRECRSARRLCKVGSSGSELNSIILSLCDALRFGNRIDRSSGISSASLSRFRILFPTACAFRVPRSMTTR